MMKREELIKREARRVGFDLVGIANSRPSDLTARYRGWLAQGYHAGMGYLARPDAIEKRADLRVLMPGVRSVVVVGMNYYPGEFSSPRAGQGRVSRYAWGVDYHDVMMEKLEILVERVTTLLARKVAHRAFVDFGALMERELARRAGLGWFGKNTNLIHPTLGSYLFLGELLLDVALDPDSRTISERCGNCTACLDACPTGALVAPGVLDARRCISYLTVEHRGSIPESLRSPMGDWVFGCDVCQEVCPWNRRFSQPADASVLRPARSLLNLMEVVAMDDRGFRARFRSTPLRRARRTGLVRNAAVILGNQRVVSAVPMLRRASRDDDPVVCEHAAWALGQIRIDRQPGGGP